MGELAQYLHEDYQHTVEQPRYFMGQERRDDERGTCDYYERAATR